MNKSIKILGIILAVQVALLVLVNANDSSTKVFDKTQNLLSIDFDSVDKVVLSDGDKNSLVLRKENSHWVLPDSFNFPIAKVKTKKMLDDFKAFKQSWPVGKTLLSAKQFSVVKDKFERKFEFYASSKLLKTLYVGTSPSFKKVHTRVDGDDNTYVIKLNSYDYTVKPDDWFDKKLYKLSKDEIDTFDMGDINLKSSGKEGKEFVLNHLKPSEEMNLSKVNQVLNNTLNPEFNKVLGASSYKVGKTVLSYKLKTKKGKALSYEYSEAVKTKVVKEAKKDETSEKGENLESENLVLKISEYPYAFEVSRSVIKNLLETTRTDLIKVSEKKERENNISAKAIDNSLKKSVTE